MQSAQKFSLNGNTDYFRNLLRQVKIGSIIPLYKKISRAIDPVELFAKISDYGQKENSILLESASLVQKYGENSIGSADPCLRISGKGAEFRIRSLNSLGSRLLAFLKDDFGFCDNIRITDSEISGTLSPQRKNVSEEERLRLRTHIDLIRAVAFRFQPIFKPFVCYGGLFGAFSYDFIDQFEDLPKDKKDEINENDYEFFFLDNLFFVDHRKNETYFVANALKTDEDHERLFDECLAKIEAYEAAIERELPEPEKTRRNNGSHSTDMPEDEFISAVGKIKDHLENGDVFQCVLSRTVRYPVAGLPLDIYKSLRRLNPSPYMFFENFGTSIILGASPEMSLRVEGDNDQKKVEIRPIAGTRPRGIVGGNIDTDLDSRYEIDIKTDDKELAEHTMLVDLARNDIARIAEPGTRVVDESYSVEKYSHVQHLVSNVKGILRKDLDCLHAYLATMNMGTLTGAPKIRAMQFIRQYENTKRGFYGGSVLYVTPSGDMDSCIIIRSMAIKNNVAYIRSGAGIVLDSVPEKEFEETEKKAIACIKAINDVGDFDE